MNDTIETLMRAMTIEDEILRRSIRLALTSAYNLGRYDGAIEVLNKQVAERKPFTSFQHSEHLYGTENIRG